MTEKQVLEYLSLVDRKLQILLNSGISWKPEYEAEMKTIDARLAELRPLVDAERKKKEKEEERENETAEKTKSDTEEND